ncbi:hypothetical protein JHW48_07190 [Paracoccus aestuarii]|nr:hypothetical protein JHW48_07190 [Paracoccus aestuarii]
MEAKAPAQDADLLRKNERLRKEILEAPNESRIVPDALQMIDSTVIRPLIRQRAPKGDSKTGFWPFKSVRWEKRSTGSFSGPPPIFTSKVHLRVNAAGLPIRSDIALGQTSRYQGFALVMDDNLPEPCILPADRGHDFDKVRKTIEALPCHGIFPPPTTRVRPKEGTYDEANDTN